MRVAKRAAALFIIISLFIGPGFAAQVAYTKRNLNAERDGLNIYGSLIMPNSYESGKLPLVIFAHGFYANGLIQQDVAFTFAEMGIASYCFDFCGGSPFSRSDGVFADHSILTEVEDLRAVLDLMLAQEFVDPARVYIFGESMGGAVAALTAAERDDVAGLLLWYPAFSISEQTRAVYASDEDIPETAAAVLGIRVSHKFYADARSIDIYPSIAKYEGPVLIFQGDADTIVPPYYVKRAMDFYKNAELIIYAGEGHGFSRGVKAEAVAAMIEFIQQTTKQAH